MKCGFEPQPQSPSKILCCSTSSIPPPPTAFVQFGRYTVPPFVHKTPNIQPEWSRPLPSLHGCPSVITCQCSHWAYLELSLSLSKAVGWNVIRASVASTQGYASLGLPRPVRLALWCFIKHAGVSPTLCVCYFKLGLDGYWLSLSLSCSLSLSISTSFKRYYIRPRTFSCERDT